MSSVSRVDSEFEKLKKLESFLGRDEEEAVHLKRRLLTDRAAESLQRSIYVQQGLNKPIRQTLGFGCVSSCLIGFEAGMAGVFGWLSWIYSQKNDDMVSFKLFLAFLVVLLVIGLTVAIGDRIYSHIALNRQFRLDMRDRPHNVEGETDDPAVMSLRRRLVKNAFAALLCSRGPAMFFAGDEFCNTQYGNNNAYCQDNIISWLDWNRLEEFQEIHDFARFMIHFRAKHPILRRDTKPAVCGLPSVSIHNGEPNRNYTDYNTHLIGIMYAGRNADDTDDDMIFYGMNAYWEPLEMRLPSLPESYHWKLVVNTFCEYQDGADFEAQTQGDQTRVRVPERSTVILLAEHDL